MRDKGFTFLEVAIVMVVIGLVVAGVLVGKNLIRSSEIRSISVQSQAIKSSILLFREKYNALPGDMKNAFDFWPTAGCTNTSVIVDDNGCNGDGNGEIYWTSWYQEGLRAWQHLSLAGMIEGQYLGIRVSSAVAANRCVVGQTNPASSTGAGWEYFDMRNHAGLGITAEGPAISLGFPDNLCMGSGVLKPAEAESLDSKMDDGVPFTGSIMGNHTIAAWRTSTCRDATGDTYTLTNDARDCYMLFPLKAVQK